MKGHLNKGVLNRGRNTCRDKRYICTINKSNKTPTTTTSNLPMLQTTDRSSDLLIRHTLRKVHAAAIHLPCINAPLIEHLKGAATGNVASKTYH